MTTTALDRPQRLATGGASSPRTAFVLSGSAGLGALQVGMLEALYERGMSSRRSGRPGGPGDPTPTTRPPQACAI
jgi:hypothetical protein